MSTPGVTDLTTAGMAALSICESLLLALIELKILDAREARALLVDAAATHRTAALLLPDADEHCAIAAHIERIMDAIKSPDQ